MWRSSVTMSLLTGERVGEEARSGRIGVRLDASGEGDQRLHRARNVAEHGDELFDRVLDPLADLAFLRRLQQLALADVLQVHPHQVDILAAAGDARLERVLFGFL